jgi:protein-disulfide isomerase
MRSSLFVALGATVAFLGIDSPGIAQSAPAPSTCAAPCSAPSLAAPPTPAAAPPAMSTAAKELAEIDAAIDQAAIRGDRDAIARQLDDAMFSIDANSGSMQTREQLLKQVSPSAPALQYKTVESDVVVKTLGDMAVISSKKADSWMSEGRTDTRLYHETNTYARRGGAWKMIVSVHAEDPPPYSPKDVAFDVPFDPVQALGDSKASVVIYEFGDYECEMCRKFAADTMGRVHKEYVATGKVAVVFRDYPLSAYHKRALAAAKAGRCASDAGKRWPMTERLLVSAELSDADIRKAAHEVGLDSATFEKCLADPATAQRIKQDMTEASDMGVRGTPMFLVGIRRPGEKNVRGVRMIEGAVPYETFQRTLDGLLRVSAP